MNIPISVFNTNILIFSLVVSVFAFIAPSPWLLGLMFILICVCGLFLDLFWYDISLLLISLVMVLLNWSYIGMGIMLFNWESLSIAVIPRVVSLAVIFVFMYKYFYRSLRLNKCMLILTLMVLFSFIKSPYPYLATQYLLNVYLPLLLSMQLFFVFSSDVTPKKDFKKFDFTIINLFIGIFLVINAYFIVFDYVEFFDLAGFYSEVVSALRGGDRSGEFYTVIAGIVFKREPGILADPIIAGYFLSILFFFFIFFIRNNLWKLFLSGVVLLLILITFSKGSYLLVFLGAAGLYFYRINTTVGKKTFLVSAFYTFFLVAMIIRAMQPGVTDSSKIHVLGLVLPFTQPINLKYFLGNDLGSGGNMSKWISNTLPLDRGAESFIGLLMYNLGIIGVLLLIFMVFRLIYLYIKRNDSIGMFFISAILPIFWTSFMQENVFNLSYTVPRLILFIFAIIGFIVIHSRDKEKENCNLEGVIKS